MLEILPNKPHLRRVKRTTRARRRYRKKSVTDIVRQSRTKPTNEEPWRQVGYRIQMTATKRGTRLSPIP